MLRFLTALCVVCTLACTAFAQSPSIPEPTLPPSTRTWTLEDLSKAGVALHKQAQDDPTALPRYSISSRSVFGRMTSPGIAEAADLPAGDRLRHTGHAISLYEQILLIYARAHRRHGGFDIELAELSGVLLHASGEMATVLQLMGTPDQEGVLFQAGLGNVFDEMARMVQGVVEMATDPDVLSLAARERLLQYAADESAPIAAVLQAEGRSAVAAQIAATLKRSGEPELGAALRRLQAHYAR